MREMTTQLADKDAAISKKDAETTQHEAKSKEL